MFETGLDTQPRATVTFGEHGHPLLLGAIPHIVVLFLTIAGVAYTGVAKQPLIGYWEMLGAITGVVCVISGWPHARDKDARIQLIWTQAFHWLAFLVAMNLVLMSDVQKMLNADATGLAILLLLALGTFVAGIHTLSWQTCVLGLVMALGVPAIAWIEGSALILLLAVIALICFGCLFWWFQRRHIAPALH